MHWTLMHFLLILIFPHSLRYWKVDAKTERLDIFERNFTVQAVQLVNRKRHAPVFVEKNDASLEQSLTMYIQKVFIDIIN